MTNPLILVDADGVLLDFLAVYLDLHSHLNERSCERSEVTNFDFTKCIASPVEDERIWRHFDATRGLVENIPVMDGALEGLDRLRAIGRVVCVASPHTGPFWSGERFKALLRLGFSKRDVVLASDKTLIPGDMLIDDRFETVMEWSRAHPKGVGVVFDATYNQQTLERRARAFRAKGWGRVVSIAEAMLDARTLVAGDIT